MGSAEVIKGPEQEVVFIEDMKEEDIAKIGVTLPCGLNNLGNTCYMNSTIQVTFHLLPFSSKYTSIKIPFPPFSVLDTPSK